MTTSTPLPFPSDLAGEAPTARHAVEDAITSRRSLRAFLPRSVSRDSIEHLLDVSARAPSGTNMQPWRVHALAGAPKQTFCDGVTAAYLSGDAAQKVDYKYYPDAFFEPYLGRRRKVGWDLYTLLGIKKGDHAAMKSQHAENFRFFGAPVGLIFTIDRRLEIGSWLDYGMFLENIMIAARGQGLDTCPQAAFAYVADTVRAELGLDADQVVVCGMAIGFADPAATINQLTTERVAARDFTTFSGF